MNSILSKLYVLQLTLLLDVGWSAEGAVMAPPWANPKLNPCASQPRGWQLLFWPPDGKCYKIFQVGYPCPEGMELSPSNVGSNDTLSAECRCPPKTAQSAKDGRCYAIYTAGPCDKGFFFAPDTNFNKNNNSKRKWGICKQMKACFDSSYVFWPQTGNCYQKLTRGPCPKGQLLTLDSKTKIPSCKCNKDRDLRDFHHRNGQCYQHFTRGPCLEKGHLFLPNRTCGCHSFLPHFHDATGRCYELGTLGPCNSGEIFTLNRNTLKGTCLCKPGYIRYNNSTSCFRPFTQGPCAHSEILVNSTTCLKQPCAKAHLYFPKEDKCYRIGTRGPCPVDQIVSFDFTTRPSLDGISFNGVCICERKNCSDEESKSKTICDNAKGLVKYNDECHKLYMRGPCPRGSWLVPKRRQGKQELFQTDNEKLGICECIPGHSRVQRMINGRSATICVSPTVILADYLNRNFTKIAQFK